MFPTLIATAEYWQIRMSHKEVYETGPVTQYGLFRSTKIPFELKNAPAAFQRAVNVILASVMW